MKIVSRTLLLSTLITASTAHADAQLTLQVKGAISPPSCDLTLDQQGVLDWQQIDSASLSTTHATPLPARTTHLNVRCETATLFALRAKDIAARAAEAGSGDATLFSLGTTRRGKAIGSYTIRSTANSCLVDGKKMAALMISDDRGKSWQLVQGELSWTTQGEQLIAFSDGVNPQPLPAKNAVITLRVTPSVAARQALDFDDSATLAGSTTFDLVYL